MASGQFVTAKLMRSGSETPWGFRLQGGLEFGQPLSVVKVTPGSLSDQTGVQVGDILLKINGKECDKLRHKDAQDAIICAGNYLELYLERGPMNTWRPSVTPVGDSGRPTSQAGNQQLYTRTSLAKSPEKMAPIGSGHNTAAKPFANQAQPTLVHKQYNSPVNLYSERNIEETLNAHSQVLATGATGINFMRPDAPVNKESAVYQMVHDEEVRKSKGISGSPDIKNGHPEYLSAAAASAPGGNVVKHVSAPSGKPIAPAADNPNRNICSECEKLIVGVFVRINNKSLHAECFRCATCGTSLKNSGYFNINDKLYCDIHARQVKAVLGASATLTAVTAPALEGTTYQNGSNQPLQQQPNGYSTAPQPAVISPPPVAASIPAPVSNNYAPYQPQPSQMSSSQNGFHSYSSPRKYSPVAPPTAPKPNFANRNSMYVNNPSAFSVETHSTSDRQTTTQHSERPKSCFNLPSYSVTQSTYSTSTTNHPQQPNSSANVQFPKTATFASSTQTTTQKVIQPPSQLSQQTTNFGPAANSAPRQQWQNNSSSSNFAKTLTTLADSRSAPRRGRGLLQSQLSGGVIPFCGYCSQPIRGQYIMALNKTWCPNHFVCANTLCKRSLEENGFVEEQGRLYCESCYETHFAPACAKCNQRIKGDCLNALDKQWHPNCFSCSYCKKPFGNSSFYLEDGFPYCEKDWNDLFTTKCVGCGLPIAAGDKWVEALNQNYHSNCFRCTVCKGNLEGQSFFAKGGRPFCRAHAR
ncbi:LIM domain-binding protein 3 [Tyrophagus putrescentiae]|nr:LIM domain-binding protein 3 [Tyrophagus putrescentiae]